MSLGGTANHDRTLPEGGNLFPRVNILYEILSS